MLTALAILGVLAVLFLVTALATSDRQALAPATPDAADLALPAGGVSADDVRGLRFGLAARGYRMSEVDAALARLAAELEERDARLARWEGAPSGAAASPVGEGGTGEATPDATTGSPAGDASRAAVTAEPAAGAPVEAPVVVAVPAVDPEAAGEAGAAAVDGVDPVPVSDAAFGQAEALPLSAGTAEVPRRATDDVAAGRVGALSFPMDFPEVQAVEEDEEPGGGTAADPPLRSS